MRSYSRVAPIFRPPWWAWTLTAVILFVGLVAAAWITRPAPAPPPEPAPAPAPRPEPPPAPKPPSIADALLELHNAERAKHSLPPFRAEARLVKAAQDHADFMAKVGRMGHMGIGDGTPWSRISATGYSYRSAGENVAWNQRDAAEVVKDWMHSPGHRANILGKYTEAGFGAAAGKRGDLYWCVTFANPGQSARPAVYLGAESAWFGPDGRRLTGLAAP